MKGGYGFLWLLIGGMLLGYGAEHFLGWPVKDYLAIVGQDTSQIWRIFTWIFVHKDSTHLMSNITGLAVAGFFLAIVQPRHYAISLVLMAVIGGWITLELTPSGTRVLGASGLAMSLYGALVGHAVHGRHFIGILGLVGAMWSSYAVAKLDVMGTVFSMSPTSSNTAHFFGFVVGWGVAFLFRNKRNRD